MGLDETIAIGATAANSQVLVVAEDAVVGHFGYGPQTKEMMTLYESKPELFTL